MENLLDLFESTLDFKVSKSTLGETNGNYVTTLKASIPMELNGMSFDKNITLYISLTKVKEVDSVIKLDPSLWNYFISDFENPETGEIVPLKWLTPKM